MQTLPKTNPRWAAIAAALGVATIGIGETMMHWTGNLGSAEPGANPYLFLFGIPEWRLTVGHFLAVIAAPIYFLGYWQVSQGCSPINPAVDFGFLAARSTCSPWPGFGLAHEHFWLKASSS